MHRGNVRSPRARDLVFFSPLAVALIVCCVLRSRNFPMWLDEQFSYNLISDPSLRHMLTALGDQADGGGPVYYILARLWSVVFSESELSLRLFTTFGLVGGLAMVWVLLRKYYEVWPAALAIAGVVAGSSVIKFEVSNVRFYGLFFAILALVCLAAARLDATAGRPNIWLLILNAVAVGALILVHPLGLLYVGAVFIAIVASHVLTRRFAKLPALIASYATGVFFLLLWLRQYIRMSEISRPSSWVPVPNLRALLSSITDAAGLRWFILPILVVWLIERVRSTRPSSDSGPALSRTVFPLALAVALCLVDPLFWIISVTFSSIYLDRYLLGVSIGVIFALAELLRRVLPQGQALTLLGRTGLALAFIACVAEIAKPWPRPNRKFATGSYDGTVGYTDLPIVCSSLHSYVPRSRYSDRADRYFMLLDPIFASKNPVEFKLASALQRHYAPRYPNIVDENDFVRTHPKFLALVMFTDPREQYRSQGFDVTPLNGPEMPDGERFYLVERRM